jgi:hypothetical protein
VYKPLSPCPGCARHVLATEPACPFCGASMPADFTARVRPEAPRRLSRVAALAFGTSLALGACADTVTGSDGSSDASDASADALRDAPPDDGGPAALYGDPPPQDVTADTVDDDGAHAAEYGGPFFDAGVDDGTPAGMYGGPPRPDATADALADAPDDDGASVFLYGAPPPPPPPDGGP